jgi:hypothetical protein
MNEQTRSRLKHLLQTISRHVIQDVPPEMYACEICRRTDCSQDEWIVCENRIAHAKCLEGHQDKAGS